MAKRSGQWRPFIKYDYDEYGNLIKDGGGKSFSTYRELKKNLPQYLKHNVSVHVFRTRRGEWGEWFEIWERGYKKPVMLKQGWN